MKLFECSRNVEQKVKQMIVSNQDHHAAPVQGACQMLLQAKAPARWCLGAKVVKSVSQSSRTPHTVPAREGMGLLIKVCVLGLHAKLPSLLQAVQRH